MTPAVFLDRDGTVIAETGYLDTLDGLELFPWTVDAIRVLNQAGLLVVLVTNQAGVARGFFDEAFVAETHRHLLERLAAGGARLDGCYYCPHHPEAVVEAYRRTCDCRKPGPGMIRQAARELGIDLPRSYVVGDRWHDVAAAQAAGARGLLVRTGHGRFEESRPVPDVRPAHIADTLIEAAAWILQDQHARA